MSWSFLALFPFLRGISSPVRRPLGLPMPPELRIMAAQPNAVVYVAIFALVPAVGTGGLYQR